MIRLISSMAILIVLGSIGFPANTMAQGLLISSEPDQRHWLPRPGRPMPNQPGFIYEIAKLEVDASIRDQVAEVQVAQTFKNRTSRTLQVKFVFPLPYDGAIDQMTFLVDGQELEGRLLEADKAREIYQSYVRRSKDPALVQWIGTGMFQTQVFPVPPGATRTVSLRYTQLCRRQGTLNDWLLPLSPAKFTSSPIGSIAIRGRLHASSKLGNVYSPSHEIEVNRDGGKVVRFEYVAKSKVPDRDFRLMWDSGDSPVQLSVVSHRGDKQQDGYFMLLIQPQLPDPPKGGKKTGKNVVLVLDKSGSMRGEKIAQARRAANYVVKKLKARDRFTLINYDSRVETFRSEMTSADKATRADAAEYVDGMLAGGSTNIDAALEKALTVAAESDGPAYVVFMTDGQPTVGEKNAMKIVENAKGHLRETTRLFSLGVGHDVNSRLLDKLASVCLGRTTYVRPGEPLDQIVSRLYDRIGSPALTDARLQLTVDGKEGRTRQLYPASMYDLFSGDQLVIVGRYRRPGDLKVKLTGNYLGQRREFVFDDELPKQTGSGENVFVERLWATRRIGQIIDDIDLHGKNQELVDELILLSKRHGILTPYTAYLAEERTDLNDLSLGRQITRGQLRGLQEEAGESAFRLRSLKSELKYAGRAAQPSAAADSFGIDSGGASPVSGGARVGRRVAGQGGLGVPARDYSEPMSTPRAPQRVKQIASKTFYMRSGRYVDSDATQEQVANAEKIEQFSDRYFELLKTVDEHAIAYFAEAVEVLVVLDGKAYLVTPPADE